MEYSEGVSAAERQCLNFKEYHEYSCPEFSARPLTSCEDPDFKSKAHPVLKVKFKGEYFNPPQVSRGQLDQLEIRLNDDDNVSLSFETQVESRTVFLATFKCLKLKPGHPIFNEDDLVGFVSEVHLDPGYCRIFVYGLKIH